MKVKLTLAACLVIFSVACNKDTFTTKPQLTFTGVNTQVLYPDQSIVFTLDFTDKEGDIQDSLYVQKDAPNCAESFFEFLYPIPTDMPEQGNAKGEIQVRFSYGINLGYPAIKEPACPSTNDTAVFKFVLHDKAGNASDTAYSPQIVLIKR